MVLISLVLNDNQWTYNSLIALRDDGFDGPRTKIHADQWLVMCIKLDKIFSRFRTTHRFRYEIGMWISGWKRCGWVLALYLVSTVAPVFVYSCHLPIALHHQGEDPFVREKFGGTHTVISSSSVHYR